MISICCVSFNRLEVVKKYIESIEKYTKQPYELIIVDNGSEKATRDYLSNLKHEPRIIILENENIGLGKALHKAVSHATGDYIFTTDVDIEMLTPGWDEKMCKYFQYPEVGWVGTRKNMGDTWLTRHKNYLEAFVLTGCCTCISRGIIDKIQEYFINKYTDLLEKIEHLEQATRDEQYIEYLAKVEAYIISAAKGNYVDAGYFYGVLDFDTSVLIRSLGLRLVVAEDVDLNHNDTTVINQNPAWQKKRKELTHDAWNYYRCKWETILDFHDWLGKWECYDSLPFNIEYKKGKQEFGENYVSV